MMEPTKSCIGSACPGESPPKDLNFKHSYLALGVKLLAIPKPRDTQEISSSTYTILLHINKQFGDSTNLCLYLILLYILELEGKTQYVIGIQQWT